MFSLFIEDQGAITGFYNEKDFKGVISVVCSSVSEYQKHEINLLLKNIL